MTGSPTDNVQDHVEVYAFEVYDVTKDAFVRPPSMRTREGIHEIGERVLEDTVRQVNRSDLDAQGRYYETAPAKAGSK